MKTTDLKTLRGAGGGGKSASASGGATEDPNSLVSNAMMAVIDLLGEGQIGGLIKGVNSTGESIFLDGTPLYRKDGTQNFKGVSFDTRNGTQDQTPMDGFPGIESPQDMQAVRVLNETPYTVTISDPNVDAVRMIMLFPALTMTDNRTGDIHGASVTYKYQLSINGGAWYDYGAPVTVNGKSRAKYERADLITLPKPFSEVSIRIIRITADSNSAMIQDESWLSNYVTVINARLAYPNSALVGVKIDARQFSNIPQRAYLVAGLYIKVPSNYDPVARTYSGVWDGTLKVAVSDNPAWILYDLLTNKRYGLGEYIQSGQVDKATLYAIGRYCDEMVPNGLGGVEPRFTCNVVIQQLADAYKVISDLTTCFRGMAFWNGSMVGFSYDAPRDPSMIFSQANVVDGLFTYSGTARKDRHSVVNVTWNDPDENYKQKIEYVEDAELIQRVGVRRAETVAFGCTSRSQANRVGRWMLYTERYESDLITFEVGQDAALVLPGEIVKIHDPYRSGRRMGGRIKSATRNSIVLDAPIKLETSKPLLSIRLPDGTLADRQVLEGPGEVSALSWTMPLAVSQVPVANAIWLVTEENNLVPVLGRVVGIAESTEKNGFYSVSCMEHNPSKYAAIEQGMQIVIPPTTDIDPAFVDPTNLRIDEVTYLAAPGVIGVKLLASWEGKSPSYELQWRRSDAAGISNWTTVLLSNASFELENVAENGKYDFKVTGISALRLRTETIEATYTVLGTMNPPGPPSALTAKGDFRAIILEWANPDALDLSHIEVYENTVDDSTTATRIANVTGSTFTRAGLRGLVTRYYWVKAVNRRGMASQFNSNVGTSATTLQATHDDLADQLINESMLVPELLAGIKAVDNQLQSLIDYYNLTAEAQGRIDTALARLTVVEEFKQKIEEGETQWATAADLIAVKNEAVSAAVSQINTAYLGPEGPIASAIQTLKTEVDGKFAAIQIDAETINGLKAQYTMKVDSNGVVAGIGLAADSSSEAGSEIVLMADRLLFVQPNAGIAPVAPFVITTINGQPKVSMNSAFIDEVVSAILKSPDNKFRIDLQNKFISIEV